MSIVKYIKDELPQEGSIVYCDNGDFSSDRAIFSNGKFIGGGDFPAPIYNMSLLSLIITIIKNLVKIVIM